MIVGKTQTPPATALGNGEPVGPNAAAAASEGDIIARVVLEKYARLPANRRPQIRDNGVHEWVPLSGIVARDHDGDYHCLSLATGMKCLPAAKVPLANGAALHDWHAEVLAIRAFNHFVLEEGRQMALTGRASRYLRLRRPDEMADDIAAWHAQPFAWRDDVSLHMYCSEAPCGDASMELTMAAQDDSTPWEVPAPLTDGPAMAAPDGLLLGRGYFSRLGVVRRKPSRADAPPTLSKSCSDKLALKQCASLLSSVASLLVAPDGVYLRSLVLPESQRTETGCVRAFSPQGRMAAVAGRAWAGGYAFAPFAVGITACEFEYSRRTVATRSPATTASNQARAWSALGLEESIIGGSLMGRKQFAVRGGSLTSRRGLWGLALDVASLLDVIPDEIPRCLSVARYQDIKDSELLAARRRAKKDVKAEALVGWVRNGGDSDFGLEASDA